MACNQRAVHDQIGVAPDGAGEMRVVAQGQPEMAKVFSIVIGLRHGTQGGQVDELIKLGALRLAEKPVQMRGFQHLPFGQHQARSLGHFAQRLKLQG